MPLALVILRFAAAGRLSAALDETELQPLKAVDPWELDWIVQAGWGALAYHVTQASVSVVPAPWRNGLLSADLTARIVAGSRSEAATEVIDLCHRLPATITLLKGISISEQHYPEAHLRPMGDIDLLVHQDAYASVEAALLNVGYVRDPGWPPGHVAHHGAPLLHPERRVWIELHTALFPNGDPLRRDGVFNPSQIAAQTVASDFNGRPVQRLSDEFQVVYAAVSLMRDLMLDRIHPSSLTPLLDLVLLLRAARGSLDWDTMLGWLDNDMANTYVFVTLDYLAKRDLGQVPPRVLSRLAAKQNLVGPLQLRAVHAMLDHCLVRGRRWNFFLPPPVPARYSFRYQLAKRLPLLLGKLGSAAPR